MFQACSASGKVIALLAEKGDMAALAAYTGAGGQKMDYMHMMQVCVGGAGGLVCGAGVRRGWG